MGFSSFMRDPTDIIPHPAGLKKIRDLSKCMYNRDLWYLKVTPLVLIFSNPGPLILLLRRTFSHSGPLILISPHSWVYQNVMVFLRFVAFIRVDLICLNILDYSGWSVQEAKACATLYSLHSNKISWQCPWPILDWVLFGSSDQIKVLAQPGL